MKHRQFDFLINWFDLVLNEIHFFLYKRKIEIYSVLPPSLVLPTPSPPPRLALPPTKSTGGGLNRIDPRIVFSLHTFYLFQPTDKMLPYIFFFSVLWGLFGFNKKQYSWHITRKQSQQLRRLLILTQACNIIKCCFIWTSTNFSWAIEVLLNFFESISDQKLISASFFTIMRF